MQGMAIALRVCQDIRFHRTALRCVYGRSQGWSRNHGRMRPRFECMSVPFSHTAVPKKGTQQKGGTSSYVQLSGKRDAEERGSKGAQKKDHRHVSWTHSGRILS